MASFQLDFKNDIKSIFDLVKWHKDSSIKKEMNTTKSYYEKRNKTIIELPDRTYWSDRTVKDKAGNPVFDANNNPVKVNGEVRNPFVSNNRIPYGIFADIVNQKVNVLCDEAPEIDIKGKYKLTDKFIKQLGYATKNAGIETSNCGEAYVFMDKDTNLTLFDSSCCIPFRDDYTNALRAFIRYIDIESSINDNKITIVEVYEEDGMTVYEKDNKGKRIRQEKTPYKYTIKKSAIEENIEVENIGKLPIIVFYNNEKHTSDMTPSVRAKIDAIDLVQSGFVNNIEDFSDVFWFVKSSNAGVDSDYYEDFIANINRTKRIFAEEATPQQFQVPHESRSKLVEIMEQQLIKETGVIDTQELTATQLTTVAIQASTMKLEQRVSDFEWQAYNFVNDIVELYQAYTGVKFEYNITFTKLLINNKTELLDNMVKVRDDMSQIDRLKVLKKIGLIDDIDETLKELEEESSYKLVDEPIDNLDTISENETNPLQEE